VKIKGKVVFLTFEGGAYGIIDQAGRKYLPVNMPNQLKRDGAEVICSIRPVESATMVMWGEPVYIYTFETR